MKFSFFLGLDRSFRGAVACCLIVAALALPGSARAATSIVNCEPSAGTPPTVKLSPAAMPPPEVAKYGVKLTTTVDGCVANSAQLAEWVTSKNGTADGASIVAAEVSLSLTGFGNCSLGLFDQIAGLPPTVGAFDPVGTLKIKWLDANGDKVKSAKPTSAFVRMVPVTLGSFPASTSTAEGIVTKGLGIGATVRLRIPITIPTGLDSPWTQCAMSGAVVPGLPPLPEGDPLKALPVSGRPTIDIGLVDFE